MIIDGIEEQVDKDLIHVNLSVNPLLKKTFPAGWSPMKKTDFQLNNAKQNIFHYMLCVIFRLLNELNRMIYSLTIKISIFNMYLFN